MSNRDILRGLAERLRNHAESPVMVERRRLWVALNNLQAPRPLIYVIPEGAWTEILPGHALQCTDPFCREVEFQLRQRLWLAANVDDDAPVQPWLNLRWRVTPGNFGVEIAEHHGDDRGSYVWDAPLQNLPHDMGKLRFRQPAVDRAGSAEDLSRAAELIGDILPARIRGNLWWTCGLSWTAIKLVGLENLMLLMYDQPDELHQLMAWLRDEQQHFITWCEREGLLTRNDGPGDGVGSGGIGDLGGASPNGPCQLSDLWGLAESQETVGVSPEMFAEFILPYQVPLMAKFRYTYYGCCEPMDQRVDLVVKAIPNLRAVSVAPMANIELLAAKLAGKYVYYRKPNPAHVCVGFNEHAIREDIRRTLSVAHGQSMALVMKDTHTVEHDLTRLPRWAAIAREEIAAAGF